MLEGMRIQVNTSIINALHPPSSSVLTCAMLLGALSPISLKATTVKLYVIPGLRLTTSTVVTVTSSTTGVLF